MAGHAQLKFVMTECSKTQIRLTGLIFSVTLWFIPRGVSYLVLSRSLSSCFDSPSSIVITSFGEEGAGLYASRAFVCLFCTR